MASRFGCEILAGEDIDTIEAVAIVDGKAVCTIIVPLGEGYESALKALVIRLLETSYGKTKGRLNGRDI